MDTLTAVLEDIECVRGRFRAITTQLSRSGPLIATKLCYINYCTNKLQLQIKRKRAVCEKK